MAREITLKVRYLPAAAEVCDVDEEKLIRHKYLTWRLPATETALVIVDAWDVHYLKSHQKRAVEICRRKIKSVMDACRKAEITIIHAPSLEDAKRYLNTGEFLGARVENAKPAETQLWPPEDFRKRLGEYGEFAKPEGSVAAKWKQMQSRRKICQAVKPRIGDCIVGTGAELQELCFDKRILHLIYVGFAANWCVLFRDYGVREMSLLNYNVIILRDCTTAIENAYTAERKDMTKFAILEAEEVFRIATASSTDFIRASKG